MLRCWLTWSTEKKEGSLGLESTANKIMQSDTWSPVERGSTSAAQPLLQWEMGGRSLQGVVILSSESAGVGSKVKAQYMLPPNQVMREKVQSEVPAMVNKEGVLFF